MSFSEGYFLREPLYVSILSVGIILFKSKTVIYITSQGLELMALNSSDSEVITECSPMTSPSPVIQY